MEARREELHLQAKRQQLACFVNSCREARLMAPPHWHEACEILYVRRGWGEQRLNADLTEYHPGDLIVICPGDVHGTEARSPRGSDIDVVQFTDALLPPGEHVRDRLRTGLLHTEGEAYRQLFDALAQYMQDGRPGQEMVLGGLIQVLVGMLMQTGEAERGRRSPVIEAVCAHIEAASDLRLERTAAQFGYSPEHLSRKFRMETGISYRAYCDRLRMRRAAGLLHEERDIASVAERLGYSDDSSFIRAFRQMYGITPGAYRRLCRPVNE